MKRTNIKGHTRWQSLYATSATSREGPILMFVTGEHKTIQEYLNKLKLKSRAGLNLCRKGKKIAYGRKEEKLERSRKKQFKERKWSTG